jgi:V/A-type H+-transporting ATPase subunit E
MSEQTLDGLIARVKSEAIEAAEKEAKQILDDAEQKAQELLVNAKSEKEAMLLDAEKDAKAIVEKGKTALDQAARDVQISVKNDIQQLFKLVLESEVKNAFTPELYSTLITKITDSLGSNVAISLPAETEDNVIQSIQNKVATSKTTPDILKKNNLLSGFSISKTDEGWSYEITTEEIADLLNQHLSPKWVELLKNA